jgi:hypothetical protein
LPQGAEREKFFAMEQALLEKRQAPLGVGDCKDKHSGQAPGQGKAGTLGNRWSRLNLLMMMLMDGAG